MNQQPPAETPYQIIGKRFVTMIVTCNFQFYTYCILVGFWLQGLFMMQIIYGVLLFQDIAMFIYKKTNKLSLKSQVLEICLTIISIIVLEIRLSLITIPIVCFITLCLRFYNAIIVNGSRKIIYIFEVGRRAVQFLTLLVISLTFEGLTQTKLTDILWIFWVEIIILLCVSVAFMLMALNKLIQYLFDQRRKLQVTIFSLIWFLMSFMTLTLTIFLNCIGEYPQFKGLVFICVSIVGQVITTPLIVALRNDIIQYCSQALIEDEPVLSQVPLSSTRDRGDVPRMLHKISQTYFGIAQTTQQSSPQLQKGHKRVISSQQGSSQIILQSETNKTPCDSDKKSNSLIVQKAVDQSVRVDQSNNQCIICFDKTPDAVLMNCGHGGLCYDCAIDLWKRKQVCYLCRDQIDSVLQVDLTRKQGNLIKVISCTRMLFN
ncbi:hypothetical protein pb186bvf_009358 [Paramecium bursaria]